MECGKIELLTHNLEHSMRANSLLRQLLDQEHTIVRGFQLDERGLTIDVPPLVSRGAADALRGYLPDTTLAHARGAISTLPGCGFRYGTGFSVWTVPGAV